MRKFLPEAYHELAEKRGFEWVGEYPDSTNVPTMWRCSYQHEWMSNYNNIRIGNGCPHCYRNGGAPEGFKRCSQCQQIYPATTEYWWADQSRHDGLQPSCISCRRGNKRRFRRENPELAKQQDKKWRENNQEHVKAYRKVYNNLPHRKQRQKELNQTPEYKEKARLHRKEYQYRPEVIERRRERVRTPHYREYQRQHKRSDSYQEWQKEYNRRPEVRSRMRIHIRNYRARKRDLPDTFTLEDWERAQGYFNHCCAVCGRQLNSLFNDFTAAADHWIPLSHADCPGTIAVNIVPLCHGIDGCNNSKSSRDAQEWLIEKFGKRRAKEILERIEAYFEWVRGEDNR